MTKKPRPTWRDVTVKELHGREKLAFALDRFGIDVRGRVAFDCGASTGGFTQALLDAGAARVFAVDAGFGQLLGSLRQDPRVVNMERTNLADARADDPIDVVTLDLSYLSLADALPQLAIESASGADLIALVKPMFELHLGQLPDDQAAGLDDAIALAVEAATANGWRVVSTCASPVLGRNGAVEGFLHADKNDGVKLYRILVPVRDIDAGATFYGAVFESPGERVGVNRHYFDCEGVVFACLDPLLREELIPNPEHVYLSTDEPLDAVRDRWLAAGGTLEADIDTYPWGETSFYGIDPWTNRVVFVLAGSEFTGGRFVP